MFLYYFISFQNKKGEYTKKQREKRKQAKVKEEEFKSSGTDFAKKKRKKNLSFIERLLGKKKTCDECGTELEYREAYDSYYCPECHTYK